MRKSSRLKGIPIDAESAARAWAQAWQHVKEARDQRQRCDEAMRRAGQQLRDQEGRHS